MRRTFSIMLLLASACHAQDDIVRSCGLMNGFFWQGSKKTERQWFVVGATDMVLDGSDKHFTLYPKTSPAQLADRVEDFYKASPPENRKIPIIWVLRILNHAALRYEYTESDVVAFLTEEVRQSLARVKACEVTSDKVDQRGGQLGGSKIAK